MLILDILLGKKKSNAILARENEEGEMLLARYELYRDKTVPLELKKALNDWMAKTDGKQLFFVDAEESKN